MKYIRTKDGRIVEEGKLEPGLKQTIITIKNKKDNKELRQIVCDDLDDYLEMVVVGEYCKCHKINPKDIRYEKKAIFNDVLKSADTIEELCDVIVCRNELFYPLTSNREGNEFDWEEINRFRKSVCMSEEEYNKIKETTNNFEPYFWNVYGAVWTSKGLIYVAKMNEKGELELL